MTVYLSDSILYSEMKTIVSKVGNPRFLLLFFLVLVFPLSLAAQDLIALHPLRASAESASMAELFFDRMRRELPEAGGGDYGAFIIDLTRLPPDVPAGGFPPYICPSPSITGRSLYAITGEASPDEVFPGAFRMRLYLWRMDGSRLLGSDEMTLTGPGDLEMTGGFLAYVLSWIEEDVPAEPVIIYAEPEIVLVPVEAEPHEENWLYVGVRGGMGYSRWTYDYRDSSTHHDVTSFISTNISAQASVYFTHFFAVQTELNYVYDVKTDGDSYSSQSLNVPLLAKFVMRGAHIKAGIFGGIYYHLPLSQSGSAEVRDYYDYTADFPGFVFGMSMGWKVGPGYLFIDGRFAYDGHWFTSDLGTINYRNSTRVSVGYEMGFFQKNK